MKSKELPAYGWVSNQNVLQTRKGALAVARNLVARRPKVLELREGLKYLGFCDGGIAKIIPCFTSVTGTGTGLIIVLNTNGYPLQFDGAFFNLLYGGVPLAPFATNQGVRDLEVNGALYLTALDSIRKVTQTAGVVGSTSFLPAGGLRGLGLDRTGPTAVLTGTGGFLPDQQQCAYYVVLGIKDENGVLVFGDPGVRTIISNTTTTSGWVTTVAKNVVCRVILDRAVTTSHFIQVYRSRNVPVGTQPDEDPQLVYQDYVSTKNVTDQYLEFTDIYADVPAAKGAYAYFARNSGRGLGTIDGENHAPPSVGDLALFKSRMFGFGVWGYETFQVTILAVGGTSGIQNGDVFSVGNAARTFTATTGTPAANQYKLVTAGASAQINNEQTALNLVEAVNKDPLCDVYAYYVSSPEGIAGKILFESKTPTTAPFQVAVGQGAKRTCFDPVLRSGANVTLSRVGTTVTATVTVATHSLRVGEQFTKPGTTTGFANGPFTILTVSSTTFTYTDASSAVAGPSATVSIVLVLPSNIDMSVTDKDYGSVVFSKPGEYEAFPRLNRLNIGGKGNIIHRAISLRNSIILFTTQGTYRITGDDPSSFRAVVIDASAQSLCPASVVKLGDYAVGLTQRGIIAVSDDGWALISEDIDPTIRGFLDADQATVCSTGFGVANESTHEYMFFFAPLAADPRVRYAIVWNSVQNKWTDWDFNDPKLCGNYDPATRTVYMGDYEATSDGVGFFWKFNSLSSGVPQTWDEIWDHLGIPPAMNESQIGVVAEWPPFIGANASGLCQWQEIHVNFENDAYPGDLSIGQYNELIDGALEPISMVGPIARTYGSIAAQGSRLTVRVMVGTTGQTGRIVGDVSLDGAVIYYEDLSERATK